MLALAPSQHLNHPHQHHQHQMDERENPTPLPHAARASSGSVPGPSPALPATTDDAQLRHWEVLAAEQEEEDVFLCELAGVARLEDARCLQAVINTAHSTVSHLGAKLPHLEELNLCNSVVVSLRDLGSGFRNLQVLWVSRCGLPSLDGLSAMESLRELYAAYNDVAELLPLASCPRLEVLDLEGNCVRDAAELDCLAQCAALQALTLAGNPVMDALPPPSPSGAHAAAAGGDGAGQRGEDGPVGARGPAAVVAAVLRLLPGLQLFDDQPVAQALELYSGRAGSGGLDESSGVLQAQPRQQQEAGLDGSAASGAVAQGEASGVEGERAQEQGGASAAERVSELELVLRGIKHARVGVDSHDFMEVEGNMLLLTAGGPGAFLAPEPWAGHSAPPASQQQLTTRASQPHGRQQQQQQQQQQQAWSEGGGDAPAGEGSAAVQRSASLGRAPGDAPASAAVAQQGVLVAPVVTASSSLLMPVSTSAWLRTLRSSTAGALASLRLSRESSLQSGHPGSVTPPLPDGAGAASVHSRSGTSSPAMSRPASSGNANAQSHQRDSNGSGHGASAAAPARPGTAARPSTAAAHIPRPFSARPGTASPGFLAAGVGSGGSTTPPHAGASSVTSNLYWKKHRINASAAAVQAFGGAAPAGSADDDDALGAGGAGSGGGSALTYGGGASIGANLARDLRRRRQAGSARHAPSAAPHGRGGLLPATAPAASSAAAAGASASIAASAGTRRAAAQALGGAQALGQGLPASSSRSTAGGQVVVYDAQQLLEELRRWKVETADLALADAEDGGGAPAGGEAAGGVLWAGASGEGPAGAGGAQVLELDGEVLEEEHEEEEEQGEQEEERRTGGAAARAPSDDGATKRGAGGQQLRRDDSLQQHAGAALHQGQQQPSRSELLAGLLPDKRARVDVDAQALAAAPLNDPRIKWMSKQRSVLSKVVRDVGRSAAAPPQATTSAFAVLAQTAGSGGAGGRPASARKPGAAAAGHGGVAAAPEQQQALHGRLSSTSEQHQAAPLLARVTCAAGEVDLLAVNPRPRRQETKLDEEADGGFAA